MSLIGITNEHDFYSQHFLDEMFLGSETLKETIKAYSEREEQSGGQYRSPWKQLSSLAREYLKGLKTTGTLKTPEGRIRREKELICRLLQVFDMQIGLGTPYFLAGDLPLPLLMELKTERGTPYLQIFMASESGGTEDGCEAEPGTDPLELCVHPMQRNWSGELTAEAKKLENRNWQAILESVLEQDNPPRWVLLVSASQWLLIDRIKFAQRRLIRFDWEELLERREEKTLQAVTVLLSKKAFEIQNGQCLLESIDEQSHRHAYGVSQDLKYALREAIESLANEALVQLRELSRQKKRGFFSGDNALDARELTDECLRYMYRLLFLFFVESRPELRYVPITGVDETYLKGYSLESLRDLELIPLTSKEEREGHFINDSIEKLFRFFSEGTDSFVQAAGGFLASNANATASAFHIEPLRSTLFDNEKMQLLRQVKFTNETLQKVIRLLSLSQPTKTGRKNKRRGRISYAHLGLNQLGSVYESLLSYSGFFAKTDLYEVKKANVPYDELGAAYFVKAEDLHLYKEEEKVYDKDPVTGENRLRMYPKGTFIYRMAGRERENSASYYTPEVLTKCVVEESLDVLVHQQLDSLPDAKAKAEKILSWRICEPAMGSAAFLNEAVNEVAELYMHYAMQVPGAKPLNQTEYRREVQKVRMLLADRNIWGVDLNPIAVELGKVSLWLNALSDDKYVPWFGLQLTCGNSLIGCRREAYWRKDLEEKGISGSRPHPVAASGLKIGEIWHFFVPDAGMSLYNDPTIKALKGEELQKISRWRKEFTRKFESFELDRLQLASEQLEYLWKTWSEKLDDLDKKTTDSYSVYGHTESQERPRMTYAEKMALVDKISNGDESFGSGEFARLKLAMDYWCSLWFWPIEKADLLPSRLEFIQQISAIANGFSTITRISNEGQPDLFSEPDFTEEEKAEQQERNINRWREKFKARYPQLAVADSVAERMRFLHWELQFANVFLPPKKEHDGFDLTVGNPPWMVASWNARGILAEANPVYSVHEKEYSAKGINDVVLGNCDCENGKSLFERNPEIFSDWLSDYESTAGAQAFYKSLNVYPELAGSASDLFKFFLPNAWKHSSEGGVQGFLHPETVYTETKGVELRRHVYSRIRKHYQFTNELKLFEDVHHETDFSVNVYGKRLTHVQFDSMNDLYVPQTIRLSRLPSSQSVEGRKTADGKWNVSGHPDRVLHIDDEALNSIAFVFGSDKVAPMLPSIHTQSLLTILEKFGSSKHRLGDYGDEICISNIWHETGAKKDGTMKEIAGNKTIFPNKPEDAIYNGSHIAVGTSFFKTPDNPSLNNLQWSTIDLTYVPDDYLPRVKYLPNVPRKEYLRRMQKVPWISEETGKPRPVTDFYRLAVRKMVGCDSERTLTSGILACGVAHVDILESTVFKNMGSLCEAAGCFASLPMDFFVRQINKANLLPELLKSIPLPDFLIRAKKSLILRTLSLNCLTSWHKNLWEQMWEPSWRKENWATRDERLNRSFFSSLTPTWKRTNALRSDLERRQALLELDVIVAQGFGLTLNELLSCYRLGFRVMRGYDLDTWYDQTGRIVFTPNSNGLRGVGLSRKANPRDGEKYAVNGVVKPAGLGFEDVKELKVGSTVMRTFMDDTLPGGPQERTIVYKAPFFRKNREDDYAEAWEYFENLFSKES